MAKYSKQDILNMVRENDVKFIRLQFTDILGQMKNVAITDSQLEKALNNQMMFDGSSIDGFVRIEESDMYLYPDFDTFVIFPWRPVSGGKTARIICDIYRTDGTPFEGDPRYILKKTLAEAKSMGFEMQAGPECEFFLFETRDGEITTTPSDQGGYFDMAPNDGGENVRRDICLSLEQMGYEIEASHHEVAQGQHEIDFKYNDALPTADDVVTFKMVVKTLAMRNGMHATFMPKPLFGISGNGMHVNMSLKKEGVNAFYDPSNQKDGLSEIAYQYIAGVLEHARAFTAITNPLVNSYKRLVPGFEAPVYLAWSAQNRSPLVRVPASRGAGTRVELRSPDPSCNPYLAFAVVLAAGLDGIKRQLTVCPPTECNIYDMSPAERAAANIASLPGSLRQAVRAMQEDSLIMDTLGTHIATYYCQNKLTEYEDYRVRVHDWEVEKYLSNY